MHLRVCFQANPPLDHSSFWCCLCCCAYPMSGWACQRKPFWIPVGDSFKKAFVEEWVLISDEPSDGQNTFEVPVLHSTDHSGCIPVTPRISKQFHPHFPARTTCRIFIRESQKTYRSHERPLALPKCVTTHYATVFSLQFFDTHRSSLRLPPHWVT